MTKTVQQLIEVPEPLHDGMIALQAQNPKWTTDRMVTAALAQFLATETGDRVASRLYLDALIGGDEQP